MALAGADIYLESSVIDRAIAVHEVVANFRELPRRLDLWGRDCSFNFADGAQMALRPSCRSGVNLNTVDRRVATRRQPTLNPKRYWRGVSQETRCRWWDC
jgi:hypothetical protein